MASSLAAWAPFPPTDFGCRNFLMQSCCCRSTNGSSPRPSRSKTLLLAFLRVRTAWDSRCCTHSTTLLASVRASFMPESLIFLHISRSLEASLSTSSLNCFSYSRSTKATAHPSSIAMSRRIMRDLSSTKSVSRSIVYSSPLSRPIKSLMVRTSAALWLARAVLPNRKTVASLRLRS